jgi:hypothetical protein
MMSTVLGKVSAVSDEEGCWFSDNADTVRKE